MRGVIFRQLASAQHSFGMVAGVTGLPFANSRGRATRARSWRRHLLAAPEILIELDHGQVKWYGARLSESMLRPGCDDEEPLSRLSFPPHYGAWRTWRHSTCGRCLTLSSCGISFSQNGIRTTTDQRSTPAFSPFGNHFIICGTVGQGGWGGVVLPADSA